MLCALIMAGGRGKRFWPLSTDDKPKQFLNLVGESTMIQMTVDRIKITIPMERIFVCTGLKYVDLVREQLPELPERNIIIEPEGRNTAPCIALSSLVIRRYYKNATMVVLPADHLIKLEDKFKEIINEANHFLEEYKDAIVTLGMKPDRPETGYGYIKVGECAMKLSDDISILKVDAFVEKPNKKLAEEYLKDGNYLWNGGIFLWEIETILNKFKKYSKNTYEVLNKICEVEESKLQEEINKVYEKTEAISIDYAILEKSKNIYVIPSDIGWDDIGSWEAIERYKKKDEKGNIHVGNIVTVDGENNLVISTGNNVVIEGVSNIYMIENDGKIIIGQKSKINDIVKLTDYDL